MQRGTVGIGRRRHIVRTRASSPKLEPEGQGGICIMEIEDLLKETQLFHNLQQSEIELIVRSTRRVTYDAGRTIIREGRVGAAFFVIVSGRVEVVKDMDGPNRQSWPPSVRETFLARLRQSSICRDRRASGRCKTPSASSLACRFRGLHQSFPEAAAQVEAKARVRLADSQRHLEE